MARHESPAVITILFCHHPRKRMIEYPLMFIKFTAYRMRRFRGT